MAILPGGAPITPGGGSIIGSWLAERRGGVSVAGDLPWYREPPLTEVVFSAALRPLKRLDTVAIGLMWRELFAEDYPEREEQAHVTMPIERFGPPVQVPTLSFEQIDVPPWPRLWFRSADHVDLLQVQRDWIALNWRLVPERSNPYPRYGARREKFRKCVADFSDFVARDSLGELDFTQCELTYINHIELPEEASAGEIDKVISLASRPTDDLFLPAPDSLQVTSQYLIEETVGRLHVRANSAYRKEPFEPITLLTLTARGAPIGGSELGNVLAFFDVAHEWIVRGFTSITRPEMHQVWGRANGPQ